MLLTPTEFDKIVDQIITGAKPGERMRLSNRGPEANLTNQQLLELARIVGGQSTSFSIAFRSMDIDITLREAADFSAEDVDFVRANLFANVLMENVNFIIASNSLKKLDFSGSILRNMTFSGAGSLEQPQFTASHLDKVTFGVSVSALWMSNCIAKDVRFLRALRASGFETNYFTNLYISDFATHWKNNFCDCTLELTDDVSKTGRYPKPEYQGFVYSSTRFKGFQFFKHLIITAPDVVFEGCSFCQVPVIMGNELRKPA